MNKRNLWMALSSAFLLVAAGCKTAVTTNLKTEKEVDFCVLTQNGTDWGEIEFCRYNPAKKSDKSDKKYPLILFLHGTPPKKHTLNDLARSGIFTKARERQDFILVAPRSPLGKGWPVPVMNAVLDNAMETLPVDPDRVYVTGFSLGGYATWWFAFAQPERFAALVPVCGSGDATQLWKTMHIPTWLTHGDSDPTVNVSGSKTMYNTLKQIGANPIMTIFPKTGHNAWSPTYKMDKLYDWMLSQKRVSAAPTEFAKTYCSLINAVSVKAETLYVKDKKLNEAVIKIEVNNTSDKKISFNGSISLPKGVTSNASTFNFELKPLEKRELAVKIATSTPMPLAEIKGLKFNWETSYSADGMKPCNFEEQSVPLCIAKLWDCPKADTPIVVDGNLKEWHNFPYELKTHDGYAKFNVVHDDKYVYVAVDVVDADINVDPKKNPWQQDGVEVRIDARPDPNRSLSKRYWEFGTIFLAGLCPSSNGKGGVYHNKERMPKGTKAVCIRTAKGYALELAIPTAYFEEKQGKNWSKFRFNVTIDDFDNGKQYQYNWQPDWRSKKAIPAYGTFSK